jgi:hypothetical protein
VKAHYLAASLALFVLFGSGGGTAAQTRPPELKMTAEVVGRRYCAGDRLNILQLSVRLRYRNEGGRKLILYRGKNFFYQTKIRGVGAEGRPYEVVVTNSRFNDAVAEEVNTRRPSGAFLTLPPGGTYEDGVVIGVAVTRAGFERPANAIAPGEHTLQIVASSWYESRKLAEELRGRWQGSGLLWIDPVATEPLKFDAGTDAPASACR